MPSTRKKRTFKGEFPMQVEPKWGPLVWWKQALLFWGLTYRGHLGFNYIISIWGNVTKSAQQSDIQNRFTLNQNWCAQQANFTDESLPETSPSLRTEPKKNILFFRTAPKVSFKDGTKRTTIISVQKIVPPPQKKKWGKTIHPNPPTLIFIAKTCLCSVEMELQIPTSNGPSVSHLKTW